MKVNCMLEKIFAKLSHTNIHNMNVYHEKVHGTFFLTDFLQTTFLFLLRDQLF